MSKDCVQQPMGTDAKTDFQSGLANDVSSKLYADVALDPRYGLSGAVDVRTSTGAAQQIEFNGINGYDTSAVDGKPGKENFVKTDSSATTDRQNDLQKQKEDLKKAVFDAYSGWNGKYDPQKVEVLNKFVTGIIEIGNKTGGVEDAKKELTEAVKELNKRLAPEVRISIGEAPKELQDQVNKELKERNQELGYMPSVLVRNLNTGERDIVGAMLVKNKAR